MKRMLSAITKVLKRRRGFTLVEMVTVVAIMGVMAAVAVPMVNNQLGKTREQSYAQDFSLIQTAIDSYLTAADNVRFLGQRQFPILGSSISEVDNSNITDLGTNLLFNELTDPFDPVNTPTSPIDSPDNPRRGTLGGEPKWRDGGDTKDDQRALTSDGSRDYTAGITEEGLNNPFDTTANNGFGATPTGGWYVDKVKFQGQFYAVDSRDYFLDFNLLVDAGFLQQVPESASPDNGGGTTDGSYSWYVKANGSVESLFYFLPSNGDAFVDPDQDDPADPADDGTLTVRGFFDGVYP